MRNDFSFKCNVQTEQLIAKQQQQQQHFFDVQLFSTLDMLQKLPNWFTET